MFDFRPMGGRSFPLWLLVALLLAPGTGAQGLRTGDYRAPTPLSLDGAVTVDTDEARALLAAGAVVPVDVLPADRQPGTGLWLVSRPRRHLPGSVWLPNVGHGELSPALEEWFRRQLERLTAGKTSGGIMFYCVTDCWMSWNAAKRAVAWGYTAVHWYPDGTDGWSFAGLDLVPATLPPATVPR